MKSLHQTGQGGESKDGMDISFCIFNRNTKELQYSGANNPLYYIRKNILYEIKTRIRLLNEETETAIKYFYMTFDSNMSAENHKAIKINIYDAYKNLQQIAISIIKEMDKLINYNKTI